MSIMNNVSQKFSILEYLMSLNKAFGEILLVHIYRSSILAQGSWWMPPDKPGLVRAVPAQVRGLELKDLYSLFQPKPFYNSVPL